MRKVEKRNGKYVRKKYLTLIQKVGYGVGDLGSNYCWTFVASFIMIYCTNTLGIRSGVIGVIMMLSKFLDGVSDVIMGRIIDRTKSKMGKARFWYALSAFPVAFLPFCCLTYRLVLQRTRSMCIYLSPIHLWELYFTR